MVFYELTLILRRSDPAAAAKVVAQAGKLIASSGGLLSKVENLGTRPLPYRMKAHLEYHTEGSYMLMQFHGAPQASNAVKAQLKRIPEVIKPNIVRLQDPHRQKEPKFNRCSTLKNIPPAKLGF
eukprot:m.8374 g.8374  ORF g.8374 m.8374 type:complete len:124 (-) comp6956_c0_seq1:224-595(-)